MANSEAITARYNGAHYLFEISPAGNYLFCDKMMCAKKGPKGWELDCSAAPKVLIQHVIGVWVDRMEDPGEPIPGH